MNADAIKTEITNIITEFRASIRNARQYAPAKWQLAKLQELGIAELMPAKFGHGDAGAVITAAEQGKSGVINAYGEGDDLSASKLYKLLHEVEAVTEIETVKVTADADGEDFEINGMAFRFYNGKLWADGGANDDFLIRSIDTDAATVEIEITAADVEKYQFAIANGLGENV